MNVIEIYKRIKDGEAGIENKQQELMEDERERIARQYNVEGDELDKLMEEYTDDDKFCEYLVDGAVLRCTGATIDNIYGVTLNIGTGTDSETARLRTILKVSENPISLNGLKYATTKDTLINTNVFPFKCNCNLLTCGPAEAAIISADESCNQDGVCKHLMNLSSEWENMHLDGMDYLKKADNTSSVGGVGVVNTNKIGTEGITRTSILFCKRGGIIYPETSGQDTLRARDNAIHVLDTYLKEGKFDEAEVERALCFLGFTSNIGLLQYSSKTGLDYNRYDDYILGWYEYYREVMGVDLDPAYIKAMIYDETKMGYYSSKVPTNNAVLDIMQALDVKNYNIYNYIEISLDEFKAKTSSGSYWTIKDIWDLNHPGELPNKPNKDKQDRCGGIVRTLFNTKKDGSGICYEEGAKGTYYLVLENVTPIMSIGMGFDLMQELFTENNGNYEAALHQYNGEGDPDYVKKIMNYVQQGNNFIGD